MAKKKRRPAGEDAYLRWWEEHYSATLLEIHEISQPRVRYAVLRAAEEVYKSAMDDCIIDQSLGELLTYLDGRAGRLLSEWEEYAKEWDLEQDPDYQEYLRLKERYE